MEKALVTVVVPLYNSASRIDTFISLLNAQTFRSFEVFFICDKSPDKTEERLPESLKEKAAFPYSVKINPKRGGVGAARDHALDSGLIKSEFVLFLDCDDNFSPEYLARLYSTIVEYNADMAICGFTRLDENTGHVVATDMCHNPKRISVSIHEPMLSLINPAPWNKLIRLSVIGNCRFGGAPFLEDVIFCALILPKCRRIAFINEPLYEYHIADGSLITSNATEALPTLMAGMLEAAKAYKTDLETYRGFSVYLTALAFMRVGVGATTRACMTQGVSYKERRRIIHGTREYLDTNFPNWRSNEFLSFRSLMKRGIKGIFLWRCRLLYKWHLFGLFVFEYKLFTSIFKKDIKW